jgi:DNA-binding HxlR family transcriptional regulator
MAPRKNFDHINTGLANALGVMGEWWTPLVVQQISGGSHRFEQIQGSLGIARNILTDRLNTLVLHEVVAKSLYSAKPRRFEYHLTDKGRALLPILTALDTWGTEWVTPFRNGHQ